MVEAELVEPIEEGADADFFEGADCRDVEGVGQGDADADGALEGFAVVLGVVEFGSGDGVVGRDVGEDLVGGELVPIEGELVQEGFEGRAGLAQGLDAVGLAVALAVAIGGPIVCGADVGEDVAGGVFENDRGGLVDVVVG